MLYEIVMGFWKNVEDRRIYLGLTRKALAQQSGIKYAVICADLERDSIPAANTALRISKVLKNRQTIIEMIHKLSLDADS